MVPEDPLFCRCEEMGLKHLNIGPEIVIGALEGVMSEYGAETPQSPDVKKNDELTEADRCLRRGVDLVDEKIAGEILQKTISNLVSS